MLVLTRKVGEQIVLPGCGVTITVAAIRGAQVRLSISAPDHVRILREEVWQRAARASLGARGVE